MFMANSIVMFVTNYHCEKQVNIILWFAVNSCEAQRLRKIAGL